MQIKIKSMTLLDLIINIFYRVRFWFYRNFYKKKLKNSSSTEKDGWNITFKDDFDKETWSTSGENTKWVIGEGWGLFHPNKLNTYYGAPEIISNTSTAKFTVKHNPRTFNWEGKDLSIPFETSLLSTQLSFKQRYGRWECRCTIPFEPTVWPAFWMWGSTWPPEIDVFEFMNGSEGKKAGIQAINLHFGTDVDGNRSNMGGWEICIQKKPEVKFHEFVCVWSPDKIEFITDGIKVMRFTLKETLEWFNKNTAEMWVIISHSIQSDIIPNQDFTSEFLVDYIRVYKNIK